MYDHSQGATCRMVMVGQVSNSTPLRHSTTMILPKNHMRVGSRGTAAKICSHRKPSRQQRKSVR
jgi:hypothetical protein